MMLLSMATCILLISSTKGANFSSMFVGAFTEYLILGRLGDSVTMYGHTIPRCRQTCCRGSCCCQGHHVYTLWHKTANLYDVEKFLAKCFTAVM